MKKSISTKKLVVSTQIIRSLQPDALVAVAGGVVIPSLVHFSGCCPPGTDRCGTVVCNDHQ